jgi:hypothetical protein
VVSQLSDLAEQRRGASGKDSEHRLLEAEIYTQGRECMQHHRARTITLTLLIISVVSPASASAGSLLSGYGGPGAGSQAIIGSTLINNPPAGGSGTASGTAAHATGSLQSAPAATSTARAGGPRNSATGKRAPGQPAAGTSPSISREPAQPRQTGLLAPQAKVESSPVLGISGTDLLYIALALSVLVLTGAFTAKLVRPLR